MRSALVRVLQEALVNVRKHSGARNVTITFGVKDKRWSLAIDDDGRGFEFTGRCCLGLDPACKGPCVIQERVQLLLESIASVMSGQHWIGREATADFSQALRDQTGNGAAGPQKRASRFGLTTRERPGAPSVPRQRNSPEAMAP